VSVLDGSLKATTPMTRTILRRRSIRSGFSGDALDSAVVEEILACGLAAPSSKNSMPWRLHAVSDRQLLAGLADAVVTHHDRATYVPHDPSTALPRPEYRSTVVDSGEVLRQVPLAIFIENLGPFSRGLEVLTAVDEKGLRSALFGYGLEMVGIGAAIENMWLAANALGLGAALLGDVAIIEAEVVTALGMAGDLVGVLAVGESSDSPVPSMDAPALPNVARSVRH
jgi:nitroreductase